MLPLIADIQVLEQERRALILYQLTRNAPDVPVVGVFREYEEYGLPGYAPLDPNSVRSTTFALMQALKYNSHVTEFVLNVKALELLLQDENPPFKTTVRHSPKNPSRHPSRYHGHHGHARRSDNSGIGPLLHFLQNNPSLTTLNIRVPPGTKESEYFVGLFSSYFLGKVTTTTSGASVTADPLASSPASVHPTWNSIQCPNLKEVTLWIPRERPQRHRMMRMMMRHPSASTAGSVRAATALVPPPMITATTAMTTEEKRFTTTTTSSSSWIGQSSPSSPFLCQQQTAPCTLHSHVSSTNATILQLSSLDDDEDDHGDDQEEDYDLTGIAHFVAQQPMLSYVRVQASSLSVQQWAALTTQLSMSKSLRHVELRRVEVDSTSATVPSTFPAPTLRALPATSTTSVGCHSHSHNNNTKPPSPTRTIAEHLALLGNGLERLDLHGTSIDVIPFMIRKTMKDPTNHRTNQDKRWSSTATLSSSSADSIMAAVPHRPLAALSWSSANIVNMQRLMETLSLPSTTLKTLELSHLNLSGPKSRYLADMLRRNTSIQHLNLSRAQLDCVDASYLAAGLSENRTLREWNLMDNHVLRSMPNAANRLTHNIRLPTMALGAPFLDVNGDDGIPDQVTAYFSTLAFKSLRDLLAANTKLEVLDLSDNGLETVDQDERYGILLQGLQHNTNLKSLKLCNQANLFLDTVQTSLGGAPPLFRYSVSQHLGNVIHQNCLQELVLNYNRFRDEDLAEYMAPALRGNTTLRVLGLKRVRMGNASMIAFANNLVHHPTLEFLDVSYNLNVTSEGYHTLAQALRTLPKLHTLWFHNMSRNRKEDALAQHRYTLILAQALEDNTSLKRMSHSEILEGKQKFYFLLNQYDRQRLCDESNGGMNIALWPHLLANMPLEVRAFYLRRNATLLSSVSSQPRPAVGAAAETSQIGCNRSHDAALCVAAQPTKRLKLER